MNIFDEANDLLDNFIFNHLNSYHQLRNYDYGIENRTNVSQISKYTSHRILYEFDIIERLKKYDKKQKYTDEILGESIGRVTLKITNPYGLNI